MIGDQIFSRIDVASRPEKLDWGHDGGTQLGQLVSRSSSVLSTIHPGTIRLILMRARLI